MASTRRKAKIAPMNRLILDSGAVIALSRNDARARAVIAAARERSAFVAIPSVVLAETVRGAATDALVNRVVTSVAAIAPAHESTGRLAGALLAKADSRSTIDALVVATAIENGGGIVLTSDPRDLRRLADGHDEVVIQAL